MLGLRTPLLTKVTGGKARISRRHNLHAELFECIDGIPTDLGWALDQKVYASPILTRNRL
jgi:hypothetical protein